VTSAAASGIVTTQTVTEATPEPAPPAAVASIEASVNSVPNGVQLPGKLGNATNSIATDSRFAKPLQDFLTELAGGALAGDSTLNPLPCSFDASYEDVCAAMKPVDQGYYQLFALAAKPTGYEDNIVENSIFIDSYDDVYTIELRVMRKKGTEDQVLPCYYHTHGGGMAIQTTRDHLYNDWYQNLLCGPGSEKYPICVIAVEFRNSAGAPVRDNSPKGEKFQYGPAPFPAGLEDCLSGIKYVYANKDVLKVSTITVSGESGGGNLSAACALYAKRKGCLEIIDGVYSLCPYIAGSWSDYPSELPSVTENDGLMLGAKFMDLLGERIYKGGDDPCAWPLKATEEDLKGLPPHVISVNECDPLRDEGKEYFRKLSRAGVSAVGRVVLGTQHAGDYITAAYSEATRETQGSIRNFIYHGL